MTEWEKRLWLILKYYHFIWLWNWGKRKPKDSQSPTRIRTGYLPRASQGHYHREIPLEFDTDCVWNKIHWMPYVFFPSFFIMTDVVSTQLSSNPPPSNHSLDRCALLSKTETEPASGNPLRKSAIHHSLKLPIHQYYKSWCLIVHVH